MTKRKLHDRVRAVQAALPLRRARAGNATASILSLVALVGLGGAIGFQQLGASLDRTIGREVHAEPASALGTTRGPSNTRGPLWREQPDDAPAGLTPSVKSQQQAMSASAAARLAREVARATELAGPDGVLYPLFTAGGEKRSLGPVTREQRYLDWAPDTREQQPVTIKEPPFYRNRFSGERTGPQSFDLSIQEFSQGLLSSYEKNLQDVPRRVRKEEAKRRTALRQAIDEEVQKLGPSGAATAIYAQALRRMVDDLGGDRFLEVLRREDVYERRPFHLADLNLFDALFYASRHQPALAERALHDFFSQREWAATVRGLDEGKDDLAPWRSRETEIVGLESLADIVYAMQLLDPRMAARSGKLSVLGPQPLLPRAEMGGSRFLSDWSRAADEVYEAADAAFRSRILKLAEEQGVFETIKNYNADRFNNEHSQQMQASKAFLDDAIEQTVSEIYRSSAGSKLYSDALRDLAQQIDPERFLTILKRQPVVSAEDSLPVQPHDAKLYDALRAAAEGREKDARHLVRAIEDALWEGEIWIMSDNFVPRLKLVTEVFSSPLGIQSRWRGYETFRGPNLSASEPTYETFKYGFRELDVERVASAFEPSEALTPENYLSSLVRPRLELSKTRRYGVMKRTTGTGQLSKYAPDYSGIRQRTNPRLFMPASERSRSPR